MIISTEMLNKFRQKKFKNCLELCNSSNEGDNVVENFTLENFKLVCDSMVAIGENNFDKINELQEQHYLFFEKVTSVGNLLKSFPIQLKLIAQYNFMFWLMLYNDVEEDSPEAEEYLDLVNKGLLMILGRQVTLANMGSASEKILKNIICFKEFILTEDHKTVLLILDLVVVILIFAVKVKKTLIKDCLNVVSLFIKESKHKVNSKSSVDEFLQIEPVKLNLFKFSLCSTATLLSDIDLEVIDCLHLLESVFLYLLGNFNESLKSLQINIDSGVKALWNYLVILNAFEMGNLNLCSVFLSKMSSLVIEKNLKARFYIMQGKLNSAERNHKQALKEFESGLALSPNCPIIHYYIGQEYGRMGLIDLMVENFEKLVQALHKEVPLEDFKSTFETTLLDWIHPADEITETEALYVLAVSHGLNESFKNAADILEKVLQNSEDLPSERKKRIIDMPNFLTVLHEAAVTNLLLGNLVRAEQIALDSISRYLPWESPENRNHQLTALSKDVDWLQKVIDQELLGIDFASQELPKEIFYSEDLLFSLPENVVGLLILSEVQRIQELDDYKTTLSNVFSIFSKYLAVMQKKNNIDEDEKQVLTLVKALAGKTCVKIAAVLVKDGEVSDVDKMYKRALSCNKGDKDALCNYYQFLTQVGKKKEAQKLWNTFSKEKTILEIDSVQSLSLKYFLTDKITKREIENFEFAIESSNSKFL